MKTVCFFIDTYTHRCTHNYRFFIYLHPYLQAFPMAQWQKIHLKCRRCRRREFDPWVEKTPGLRRLLEEGMAICSSILAWRLLWTEEPSRLQYIRSHSWTQLKQLSMITCIPTYSVTVCSQQKHIYVYTYAYSKNIY